jgi:hypothetical protein
MTVLRKLRNVGQLGIKPDASWNVRAAYTKVMVKT